MTTRTRWQSRITRVADTDPRTLHPNDLNFRRHPQAQADALEGVLDEVGWVAQIIVNERTGNIIDGHLRVEAAVRRDEATIPVTYVDLSEDEERLILATFDPITALATTDRETLDALLAQVSSNAVAVRDLLQSIGGEAGVVEFPDMPDGDKGAFVTMTFSVSAEQKDTIDEALRLAKRDGLDDAAGANGNGNALAHMAEVFVTAVA